MLIKRKSEGVCLRLTLLCISQSPPGNLIEPLLVLILQPGLPCPSRSLWQIPILPSKPNLEMNSSAISSLRHPKPCPSTTRSGQFPSSLHYFFWFTDHLLYWLLLYGANSPTRLRAPWGKREVDSPVYPLIWRSFIHPSVHAHMHSNLH